MILFRKANLNDINRIEEIYNLIHDLEESGKVEIGWIRNVYPIRQTAIDAINKDEMFIEEDDGIIVASAKINKEQVPEYKNANWQYDVLNEEVMVLHTLTVDPNFARKGYGREFVKFYEDYALNNNCHYLRIDTNEINTRARTMYEKLGYQEAGIVPCDFNGIPNIGLVCLEKKLN